MNVQRISSRQTFFLKHIFPVLWFVIVAGFLLAIAASAQASRPVPVVVWIVPLLLLAVGYLIIRHLILDLMDEVWDAGDQLIVKNRGVEARIPLNDIVNVDLQWMSNPNRITLTLRQPCRFGKQVSFCPKGLYVFPFGKNPLAGMLVNRIDAARQLQAVSGR